MDVKPVNHFFAYYEYMRTHIEKFVQHRGIQAAPLMFVSHTVAYVLRWNVILKVVLLRRPQASQELQTINIHF